MCPTQRPTRRTQARLTRRGRSRRGGRRPRRSPRAHPFAHSDLPSEHLLRWPPAEAMVLGAADGTARHTVPMRAMVLTRQREPLELSDVPEPEPGPGQVAVRVLACGVCRTDLHIVDGDLTEPKLPLVPGHQVVGEVVESGEGAERFEVGDRVGIPWLGWADGDCRYCRTDRENLCEHGRFTGYDLDGGYAELAVADERFCHPLPSQPDPLHMAPILCAGLIGYRALRMCGDAERVGLYGFGSSAHIICQVAAHGGQRVFALTRAGDAGGQAFARELG